jgi:SOS response regulatory protein OraA/RecX
VAQAGKYEGWVALMAGVEPANSRKITRLHPGTDTRRRAPVVHVFSETGYELTVPRSFRDRRLRVGALIDDADRDELRTAARLWEARSSERRVARAEKAALERPRAGQITDITEGRRGRLHIYLDGGYAFSLSPEIVEYEGVIIGAALDETTVSRLVRRAHVERIAEMIDRKTAVRPRCAGELRRALIAKLHLDAELVEAAIERRRPLGGILSDADFIAWFAQARGVRKGKGFYALVPELRALDVSTEAISAYRDSFDSQSAAVVAIARAVRGLDLSDPRGRHRFVERLRSRGFGYGVAKAYLDSLAISDEALADAASEE